jgi:hypothetical protein
MAVEFIGMMMYLKKIILSLDYFARIIFIERKAVIEEEFKLPGNRPG